MTLSLPNKDKKIEQHNFRTYAETRSWLQRNGYQNKGYLTKEPWAIFFVERWEKEGLIALAMDIHPFIMNLPINAMDKPWQVDIATIN